MPECTLHKGEIVTKVDVDPESVAARVAAFEAWLKKH